MTSHPRTRRLLDWKAVLGLVVSAAFLYLALRGVSLRLVAREIASADPWLFLGAIACATLVFWIRAWRWRSIIRPIHPATQFRNRFPAVAIGFMAMNILPARTGELVRAYVLSRREPVPFASALGSLVLEHLFDGLMIVLLTFGVLAMPGFPAQTPAARELHRIASYMGLVFGALTVISAALVIWPRKVLTVMERLVAALLPRRWRAPILRLLESLLASLGMLREPVLLLRVVSWTVVNWLVGALSFWLGMLAFGIDVPFLGGVFLQSVVAFAVALPSSPGFLGVFEAAVRFGLVEIWNVDATRAVGFAIGFHVGGYIPVTLLGFYYVWRLGMTWSEVGRHEAPPATGEVAPSEVA